MDLAVIVRAALPGYTLPLRGPHGLPHWARVLETGRRLAADTGADPDVVALFAVCHDARRWNEGFDPGHGQRGGDFARTLRGTLIHLDDVRFERLYEACRLHTDGLTDGDVTLQTCWDADRLDLGRVGCDPDPRRLCTDAARRPCRGPMPGRWSGTSRRSSPPSGDCDRGERRGVELAVSACGNRPLLHAVSLPVAAHGGLTPSRSPRTFRMTLVALLLFPAPVLTVADHVELEQNLRWMLAREREQRLPARVGVFADAGVWHRGASAIMSALEAAGHPCVVFDRTRVTPATLAPLAAVVLPGGWAPHQRDALGPAGRAAIRGYVEAGGRCVGVCAGAYLLSAEVRYAGGVYPYPLQLFDGAAVGPVPGLAPFPEAGTAKLTPTPAGRARGLEPVAAYYSGGPCFVGGSGVTVLATYPDGSAAAVARPVGRGEIILVGVHLEIDQPKLFARLVP